MKVTTYSGSDERTVVIGMIVDVTVLGHIAAKWTGDGLFASRWSNLIGGWCVDYYTTYNAAPGKTIQGLFQTWADDTKEDDTVRLVERFLESLSGQYNAQKKQSNSEYVIDVAGRLFNRVAVDALATSLQADIAANKVTRALKRLEQFAHVDVGKSSGVNVLTDAEAIKRAFERKADPLVVYEGALGTFFRDALERDALIAFMGPEKRGKTFWLIDIAWRAMLQGRRVALIEVGDMSEGQIMLRLMTRALERPLRRTAPDKPVLYPAFLDHPPESKTCNVEHDERTFADDVSWERAFKRCQKIIKAVGTGDNLRLACYPNSTLTAQGVDSLIQTWERQGWGPPDVVVIDYADVLAPPSGSADTRDQINQTWKALRALSQRYHCLVVTATQSDADSYSTETMDMGNFSEDKRKNAHVTGMVGINQTVEEKKRGLQRLNWLVLRESEFTSTDVVHVAGCLAIANPAIHSAF